MADANLPTLRIRCPRCRTIMRVAIGSSPTCASCSYAGNKGPAFPLQGSAAAAAMEAPVGSAWAEPTSAPGAWEPGQELGGQEAQWSEAPEQAWQAPATEAEQAAATANAEWQATPGGDTQWAEAPAEAWPEPAEPQPAKKRGLFGRK